MATRLLKLLSLVNLTSQNIAKKGLFLQYPYVANGFLGLAQITLLVFQLISLARMEL